MQTQLLDNEPEADVAEVVAKPVATAAKPLDFVDYFARVAVVGVGILLGSITALILAICLGWLAFAC